MQNTITTHQAERFHDTVWPHGRFLVVDETGQGHLPVRDEDGTTNHHLIGAAHAALCNPEGFRGHPYAGPKHREAVARLKEVYASQGMTWPGEPEASKP